MMKTYKTIIAGAQSNDLVPFSFFWTIYFQVFYLYIQSEQQLISTQFQTMNEG